MREVKVDLPVPHLGQLKIEQNKGRFNLILCGRRFGKTIDLITRACERALEGNKRIGIFTPFYAQWSLIYDQVLEHFYSISSHNRVEGRISLVNGSTLHFAHTVNNMLAGRGFDFDLVLIDEGAFDPGLETVYQQGISKAIIKTRGEVFIYTTPKGKKDPKTKEPTFIYKLYSSPEWKVHHAPSWENPLITPEEIEREFKTSNAKVFQQEICAQFVEWEGEQFFYFDHIKRVDLLDYAKEKDPFRVLYAVIDTALKDKKENDGTACVYAGKTVAGKLVILDYEIRKIHAGLLDEWLPSVIARLKRLEEEVPRALPYSSLWIEDKGSGTALLYKAKQFQERHFQIRAIDEGFVKLGKAGRVVKAGDIHNRGEVILSKQAETKLVEYNSIVMNHLLAQVEGYRFGEDNGADDLLDCYTYTLLIGKE